MNDFEKLHKKGVQFSTQLRKMEKNLIELLMPIERTRGYVALGYSSLYKYCVGAFGLSESQAGTFIAIARKSEEVPELSQAVQSDEVTVSNARRLISVITPQNKEEWLTKAKTLSQHALEVEVVKVNPREAIRQGVRPVAENLFELRMGITEATRKKFERAKEVASMTQEALFDEVLSFYLKHKDPIEKAKREKPCPGKVPMPRIVRRASPAAVQHAVARRDERTCQFRSATGKVCGEKLWVQTHHLRHWAQGGGHAPDNLTTVCSSHHRWLHSAASIK